MKKKDRDQVDESNNRSIASADVEDRVTDRNRQNFVEEWNKLLDESDNYSDISGNRGTKIKARR